MMMMLGYLDKDSHSHRRRRRPSLLCHWMILEKKKSNDDFFIQMKMKNEKKIHGMLSLTQWVYNLKIFFLQLKMK